MKNKEAMAEEKLDQVTGGSMIPHKTTQGETLGSIAAQFQKFNVSPADLAKWNNLGNMDASAELPVGTDLQIFI